MKVLITGANGQLGTELRRCFARGRTELGPLPEKLLHASVVETDVGVSGMESLDITDRHAVAAFVRRHAPDVIISCAAYTNVDGCDANPDDAFRVNALGARNLAMAAEEIGAKLVHVSTDYVFRGGGQRAAFQNARRLRRSLYTAKQSCWARNMCGSSARAGLSCARRGCMAMRAKILSKPW